MAESTTLSGKHQSEASSGDIKGVYALANLEAQRKDVDQRMRPEIEVRRKEAEQEAVKTLDDDAITAIQHTEQAVNAITENKINEALAAIELATGKVDILLSRNPSSALIPVNAQVTVIDTAPENVAEIVILKDSAGMAMEMNDLPAARTLLDALRSEIRVRKYHLPLATYPAALKEAARRLDEKKTREAGNLLLRALNTLVAIDQVTPIPLLLAREAIKEAQQEAERDKEKARKLLDIADHELERDMKLGYTEEDPNYNTLRDEVDNLRKQLKGDEDTTSLFTRIRDKLTSMVGRQSEKQNRSDAHKQPQKAA